jgi:hypothetical protein
MEHEVVVPVGLAIASGLAFLAYKHADFFRWIFVAYQFFLMVALGSVMIWNTAVSRSELAFMKFFPVGSYSEVRQARESVEFPIMTTSFWLLGTYAYLWFLSIMPKEKPQH